MAKTKSKKKAVMIGFTNVPMSVKEDIFANAAIVKGNKNLQPLNSVRVRVCTQLRKESCDRRQECQECEPTCEWDKRKFLGVSDSTYDKMGYERRLSRIHTKLKKLWMRCREIRLTVEET